MMALRSLVCLLCSGLMMLEAAAAPRKLVLTSVAGEGAFNNIKRRLGRDITIEVRDQDGNPVEGADVVFTPPGFGPSVTFLNNPGPFKTKSDAAGRASTMGLTPNAIEGRFNVRVSVAVGAVQETAVISQSNTMAGGIGAAKGGSGKKFVLLGLVGGGAAAGVFALKGRSGGGNGPTTPATTIAIGSISVGAPR